MTWLEILLVCIIVFAIVCLISIWHASTDFHKVFYRLSSDKISKPVKFVVLSDLHDKTYGEHNEKLLHAIDEESPDAILIAGDMLTAKEHRKREVAEDIVRTLSEKYPVYYSMGNHEAKTHWHRERFGNLYEEYMDKIQKTDTVILQNSVSDFDKENIRIYGLNLPKKYYRRLQKTSLEKAYLEQMLGQPDTTCYNILLAHNPAYFDVYAKWHPDLVVSGHVHGGLVRLPFLGGVIAPSLELFPKYDGGKFTKEDSTLIISRGLGVHSIEFRMWNPAELVVIELNPAEK